MDSERDFEIQIAPTQVLLRVAPPEEGKKASLKEIQQELSDLGVSYRIDHLFDIFRRASNDLEPLAVRESTEFEVLVKINEDMSEAYMTVMPPQIGDDQLPPEKIKQALEKYKIEKGILYPELKRIISEKIENTEVLVAQGKKAIQGEQGEIEFHIEESKAQGNVEENWVDFKELNLITNVAEGDLIASIRLPTEGNDGYTITGRLLKGHNGKRAKYRLGKNTILNEEKTEIRASKPGYVVRSGDLVSVEDIMEVPNVDSSTGNIRFTGVVQVGGQVEDGYIIEAGKGIEVNGTVGKSVLKAQGDIKIWGGAIGAELQSPKNISAKFLNESKVHAGGDVITDEYILHSQVHADRAVFVNSSEGFITGGQTSAGEVVWTTHLGSEMSEEVTKINVGVGIDLRREYDNLQLKVDHGWSFFEKYRKNIQVLQVQFEKDGELPPDRQEPFDSMTHKAREVRDQLFDLAKDHHRLLAEMENKGTEDGLVLASGTVNSGVQIRIRRLRVALNSAMESCAYIIINGQLKAQDFTKTERMFRSQIKKRK